MKWGLGAFVVCLLVFVQPLQGQKFPGDYWHDGKVFLENDEVISGSIKYNLQLNNVNLDIKSKILTFSAKKVVRFEIIDQLSNAHRYFYSLPFALTGDYKAPVFFEVLHEGSLSLLCREKVTTETVNSPNNSYRNQRFSRTVLDYDFYYLREHDQIRSYANRRNELLSIVMKDKADQIKKFMKKNRLDSDDREDLALIFQYYNKLIN